MARSSDGMVTEVVQTFWATMQRGENPPIGYRNVASCAVPQDDV